MSLTLANQFAAELDDVSLCRHYEFVVRALAARKIYEAVPEPPRRDLDELEPRVTISPRADTLPAPPPPHNPEDDGG